MAIFIKLRKDTMGNNTSTHKYYAHVVRTSDITTDDLADRLQENTTFSRGEVKGLIDDLVDEMKLQMSMGHTVVLNGFGRFHLAVESKGADSPGDFDIAHNIKRVKCKFMPAGTRGGIVNGTVTQVFGKGVDVKWFPGCENGRNLTEE